MARKPRPPGRGWNRGIGEWLTVNHRQVMHGAWQYFDGAGVLRCESMYARGVEVSRSWHLERGEHPGGARRRGGPVARGMWVPDEREATLEHGTWTVEDKAGRVLQRVELGPALDDARVLALPALADEATDEALAAIAEDREAARVLDRLCARIRLAGRRATREPVGLLVGPGAPWTTWLLDGTREPLAARAGRLGGPPLMELLHGLTWGAPPADVLHALSAIAMRRDRPRLALDLVRAALLYSGAPALHAMEAACLRELGDDAGADAVLATMPAHLAPEEERLLDAIRDAPPADDQPRLVYADWLLERGDPRGELISTQCTLARTPADAPDRARLVRRERELFEKYGERWCGGIVGLAACPFERGFLREEPRVSVEVVVHHADRLWRAAPFRRLHVRDYSDAIAQLATSPALARYRALLLVDMAIDEGAMSRLARCPYLGDLEDLALIDCRFGDDELIALAASLHLARLRALDLGGSEWHFDRGFGFGAVGVLALSEAVFAPRLERIGLWQRYLDHQLAGVLAAFSGLVRLELGRNRLGSAGAARLAAGGLERLTELGLYENGIGDEGAIAIARSRSLPALRWLDLGDNGVTDAGALAIAESHHLASLTYVSLRGSRLGRATIDALRARFGRGVSLQRPVAPPREVT